MGCNCNQSDNNSAGTIVEDKLGKCTKCMFIAFLGTLISWIICIVIYLKLPDPIVYIPSVGLVVLSFTIVFVAHVIAFIKHSRLG